MDALLTGIYYADKRPPDRRAIIIQWRLLRSKKLPYAYVCQ